MKSTKKLKNIKLCLIKMEAKMIKMKKETRTNLEKESKSKERFRNNKREKEMKIFLIAKSILIKIMRMMRIWNRLKMVIPNNIK